MTGYLLDTMTIFEGAKARPHRGLAAWLSTVEESSTYVSALTIGELQKGIALLERGSARRAALERWLTFDLISRFGRRILAFDTDVARHWGTMIARALERGVSLSIVDSQIAATASLYGLHVVTRNARHFAPTGIATFDPWAGS
ncbi:MAG TPA: type II toxin-antitoxin system VapC family toxin [Candidatus Binatia bacterium]|nr:type II toxin-antitoxin system VapC family toxin [Candidatus Binatia bacterium]